MKAPRPARDRKSGSGNVRLDQRRKRTRDQRILNTNIRSPRINRLRVLRRCKVFAKIVAVGVFFVALIAGSKMLIAKVFYENPQFALTELQIETDGALTEAAIQREAGIREGMNLLGADIEGIRAKLSKLAQVGSVTVERQLPNRLIIKIEERHPVAWLSCPTLGIRAGTSSGGFLLDGRGTVIDCETMLDDYLRFPVIRARSLSRVRPGQVIESAQVVMALEILRKSKAAVGDYGMEIVVIDLPTDYSMEAIYEDGARITFGMEDLNRQMEDLKAIVGRFEETSRLIKTLDLMPKVNIPVTFKDAPARAGTRRKAPKSVVHSPRRIRSARNPVQTRAEVALRNAGTRTGDPRTGSRPAGSTTPSRVEKPANPAIPGTRESSPAKGQDLKIRRDIRAILRES